MLNDILYALRSTDTGRFSNIYYSQEEVEKFVQDNAIHSVEIGFVTFTKICEIPKPQIVIPWQEGLGSLIEGGSKQPGAGDSGPPLDDGPVRNSAGGEVKPVKATPKRGRKRDVLSPDGGVRE